MEIVNWLAAVKGGRADTWDQRYASREQVWSGQPNSALVTEVTGLPPGRALDVGCGEGADAIWLATTSSCEHGG